MKVSKDGFFSTGSSLDVPKEQLEAFWSGLEKLDHESSPFAKYLFYLGAMVVISAMTWFMSLGWAIFGGGGIFLIAVAYIIVFTLIGNMLWEKKGLRIPAGLLITIAVCIVPLAIYGLEAYFNLWPTDLEGQYNDYYSVVDGKWIFMELGTIFAGIIALYFFPFPFLTAPIFFSVWFLTMDIVPFVFGKDLTFEQKSWLTMCFGLVLIVIAFAIDRRRKEKFAFWSYLFGTLSFWIGLNCLVWDKNEGGLFLYLIINFVMMCLAVLVRRNVLMIFGAIGVFTYLSHLTYSIFEDSILFPFILTFIGLAIIYLGILYQKNIGWIEKIVFQRLPPSIQAFLDRDKDC